MTSHPLPDDLEIALCADKESARRAAEAMGKKAGWIDMKDKCR